MMVYIFVIVLSIVFFAAFYWYSFVFNKYALVWLLKTQKAIYPLVSWDEGRTFYIVEEYGNGDERTFHALGIAETVDLDLIDEPQYQAILDYVAARGPITLKGPEAAKQRQILLEAGIQVVPSRKARRLNQHAYIEEEEEYN